MDGPAFKALFDSFNSSRSNQLALPEYIGMTLFLQSAAATFRAFDPSNQGRIVLNFDQVMFSYKLSVDPAPCRPNV